MPLFETMRRRRYQRRISDPLPDRAAAVEAGERPWRVYVLTDDRGERFSVSFAKDVGARLDRHREPSPLPPKQITPRLVLIEEYADRYTALARMKRMRVWSRDALIALVAESNPDFEELSP